MIKLIRYIRFYMVKDGALNKTEPEIFMWSLQENIFKLCAVATGNAKLQLKFDTL